MNAVFIDSSLFKGIIDPNDDFHDGSLDIWKTFIRTATPLVTTNYILDETYTMIRVKCNRERALELRDFLGSSKIHIQVERVTVDDDAAAWEWFDRDWSKLSFTDCVSFAIMKRLGITEAGSFDEHFAKAGFHLFTPKQQ